jgi:creatinine amidohydrolase/Fe(II)-dependent formamide hydrolase-like protein
LNALRLAELTWPDVAQAVAAGVTTVILPLGATEQHGSHLPLGTDTCRAAALAERLAERLPVLVAPVIPISCSDEHSGFAGLLSLEAETLAAVIVDCVRRMVAWGMRRLVVLSAHGGNGQALALAETRLQQELPHVGAVDSRRHDSLR